LPYIPFTDEQKVLANSVNLEEFLRMRGEKLERVGREHKLIYYDSSGKHDSNTARITSRHGKTTLFTTDTICDLAVVQVLVTAPATSPEA
jgi:hypothetical protein